MHIPTFENPQDATSGFLGKSKPFVSNSGPTTEKDLCMLQNSSLQQVFIFYATRRPVLATVARSFSRGGSIQSGRALSRPPDLAVAQKEDDRGSPGSQRDLDQAAEELEFGASHSKLATEERRSRETHDGSSVESKSSIRGSKFDRGDHGTARDK